ncbi:MAG TPA: TlpA disulfide reductase family protein, partial [Lacipirellulaceae bacterium]|nr:TlpA disulfide reductase family protein [Lacipirellulaceae bacterium]
GRLLTIVDVLVPTEQVGSTTGADGKQEQFKIAYEMRAWLDLERGGVPALLKMWYGSEKSELDERLRALPWRVITTAEVKELESGAFYPTRTVEEEFNTDPKTPSPSDAEWAEVRAGKRASPPQVVFQRRTWECSAIDTNPFGGEQFFVLTFPAGAAHFDLDAGKVVGALETTPPIPLGEPAPPLDVARWVDGQQRSLEDFRGKVVVLHFWSFSCSGCLRGIPALNAVQQKFQDHPVVFISVHQACHDADSVVNRIDSLAKETHWGYLAAIDAGTMAQNSATFYAYGCAGQPTEVILGRDGRVAWHSGIPPAGMESFYGKSCDEITADDEAVINRYMQAEFEAAGETWPMAEGLPEEEQLAVSNRMLAFQIGRHIEAALASASAK